MKNISALFLVLLLAPFTFAQSDNIIEMIQKTDEGKEIIDSILLEASIQGDELNSNHVGDRLNTLAKSATLIRSQYKNAATNNNRNCKSDLYALKGSFHSFTIRLSATNTQLHLAEKSAKRKHIATSRVKEELSHFTKFSSMNKENSKLWGEFSDTTSHDFKIVKRLIARIRTIVHQLHREHSQSALIELPNTYKTSLSEISIEFQSTSDDLEGFRPIVNNLLEIVKSASHLHKRDSRKRVRSFIAKLSELFHDKSLELMEENEKQKSLFSNITVMFNEAITKCLKVLKNLEVADKKRAAKLEWLNTAKVVATQLAELAGQVVVHKSKECKHVNNEIRRTRQRFGKFLDVIRQLQEVLRERFGALKTFFIEKMDQN